MADAETFDDWRHHDVETVLVDHRITQPVARTIRPCDTGHGPLWGRSDTSEVYVDLEDKGTWAMCGNCAAGHLGPVAADAEVAR